MTFERWTIVLLIFWAIVERVLNHLKKSATEQQIEYEIGKRSQAYFNGIKDANSQWQVSIKQRAEQ